MVMIVNAVGIGDSTPQNLTQILKPTIIKAVAIGDGSVNPFSGKSHSKAGPARTVSKLGQLGRCQMEVRLKIPCLEGKSTNKRY